MPGSPLSVGDISVVPLVDGWCQLPTSWYAGIDWSAHAELLSADGRFHIPIGCYLVRTGGTTVLLDAGMGPVTHDWGSGGALLDELRAAGVSPADVDVVVCSHLHPDHAGWLADDGAAVFPSAVVRFGEGDWARWVAGAPEDDRVRRAMELLAAEGRLSPISGDDVALAPGLTARFTPGHTEGHYALVLASGADRAYLLGDAVECPLQLDEPDFHILSDMDPALARRTREAVWREVEGSGARVGGAHFPELRFGRVLPGEGRRYWQVT